MNFLSRNFHRVLLTFNLYSKRKKLALASQDSRLARIILEDGRHYSQISLANQAKILIQHIQDPKSSFLLDLHKKPLRKRPDPSNNYARIAALDAIMQVDEDQTTQLFIRALYNVIANEKTNLKRINAAVDLFNLLPNKLSQILAILIQQAENENFCAEFINNLRNYYKLEEELVVNFHELGKALSYPNIAKQISLTTRLAFILFHLKNKDTNIIKMLPSLIANFSATDFENKQKLKNLVMQICSILQTETDLHGSLFAVLANANEDTSSMFVDDFKSCCETANTSIATMLSLSSHLNIKYLNTLFKIGLKDFNEAKALLENEDGKIVIQGYLDNLGNADPQEVLTDVNELVAKHFIEHPYDTVLLQTKKFLEPYNRKFIEDNCKILGISLNANATLKEEKRQFVLKSREFHPDKTNADSSEDFIKLQRAHRYLQSILPAEQKTIESDNNSPAGIEILPQPIEEIKSIPKVTNARQSFFGSIRSFLGFGRKTGIANQENNAETLIHH